MTISDGFKKLTLAAIGAGAITYEKTSEILGHLVEKGEITVDQGKIINSELKHNVKESVTNQKKIVKEAAQKVKEEAEEKHAMKDENTTKTIDQAAVEAVDEAAKAAKDVIDFVSKLSVEQITAVRKVIDSLEYKDGTADDVAEKTELDEADVCEDYEAEEEIEKIEEIEAAQEAEETNSEE